MGMLSYWVRKRTPNDYVTEVRTALTGTVAQLERHLATVSQTLDARADAIDALVREREAIVQAFRDRWQADPPSAMQVAHVRPPADLLEQLTSSRLPWFESGKASRRQHESLLVAQRLWEIEQALVVELRTVSGAWRRALPANAGNPSTPIARLLPGLEDSPRDLAKAAPGEGPLVLQVGDAAWTVDALVPGMQSDSSWALGQQRVAALPPATSFASLIDFVQDGGFVTDHRASVESAVARLLALVPAGQLKVHLYDPVKVGASLSFLSDLGDAARAAVTDNRVGVVPADLEPLLDELTRHIARVTQQYLGSRHRTLAEYNTAAGEVAEAYHLLVLMDYPAGRIDDEVVRKLNTLVQAGPACGVFVLIHSTAPEQYSSGLPVLRDGIWGEPSALPPRMRGVVPTLRVGVAGPPSGPAGVDAIRSKDWRRAVGLIPMVHWSGSAWSPSTDPAVQQLVRRLDRDIGAAKPTSVEPAVTARRARSNGDVLHAQPDDPSTWWRKHATTGLEATFGVSGDRGVGSVVFESKSIETAVLVGGQQGSGKSVLLHALIGDLIRNYAPSDLSLYLLDPKEGVEFTVYAEGRLPHARVVTVKAPAESTIAVLEKLRSEISDRGARFNRTKTASGAPIDKIDDYLAAPGAQSMPRVVAIVDEFQLLLNAGDDTTSMRVSALLDDLIRLGRSFGVHIVLATQSLQGIRHLPTAVTQLTPSRVALQMSDDDSRFFLGQNSVEAARLGRGEGKAILVRPGKANRVVQVSNETKDSVASTVRALVAKGTGQRPVVLDFSRPRPPSASSAREMKVADTAVSLSLLVARGLGMTEPVQATLPADREGNLLAVVEDGGSALAFGVLSTMMATCAVSGVPFDVVDFSDLQSDFDRRLGVLQRAAGRPDRRFARGNLLQLHLDEALGLAEAAPDGPARTRRVLFLTNTQRSRELTKDGPASDALGRLLEIGGRARVHVVLHTDSGGAAGRVVRSDWWDAFGTRVVGRLDPDDGYRILGNNLAEKLAGDQLLVWARARGVTKAVPFAPLPPKTWAKL